MVRVLLADDHPNVRKALKRLLSTNARITIVGEAADGKHAVEMARACRPDILLMEVEMPVMDGVAAARAIRAELPGIRVIGIADFPEQTRQMLDAGAVACVLKSQWREVLPAVIHQYAAEPLDSHLPRYR